MKTFTEATKSVILYNTISKEQGEHESLIFTDCQISRKGSKLGGDWVYESCHLGDFRISTGQLHSFLLRSQHSNTSFTSFILLTFNRLIDSATRAASPISRMQGSARMAATDRRWLDGVVTCTLVSTILLASAFITSFACFARPSFVRKGVHKLVASEDSPESIHAMIRSAARAAFRTTPKMSKRILRVK